MPILADYEQFNGRYWETGTVANHWAYRGVVAPHTGEPFSEALLLGVSGGIVMGYFVFAYDGYDPMARILTRNTFDPMDTMLSRLGVVQHIEQTASAEKGVANVVNALDDGVPPIVWADSFSLPYNGEVWDEGMWAMFPIVVYGYDEAADMVLIADRARVGLTVTVGELAAARGRVQKMKNRVLTLDPPREEKLVTAVQAGIWDTIKLFTEKPPKGSKNNFGFAAYQQWAKMLTAVKGRGSWAKEFPAGRELYAGLCSAFTDINTFGKVGFAERDVYAAFLDEAAVILERPALNQVADQFRKSAQAWEVLSLALLPDEVSLLQETRQLMLRKRDVFLDQENGGIVEMADIKTRLAEIKTAVSASSRQAVSGEFPLDDAGVSILKEAIAAQVMQVHDSEQEAVASLQAAMG
jgi:hypothetical protein